jgi:DNA-binding transcriptional LysR family regulator
MIIESAGRLESVPQARRLRTMAAGAPTVVALDNIFGHLASVRAGIGLVGLPCYMGAHEPDLLPVLPDDFALELPLWLLTRSDLRTVARIRAVLDFITSEAAASLPQA